MAEQERHGLNELRAEIDALDDELVRLLNLRAELSVRVGKTVGNEKPVVFAPEREAEVLARVQSRNGGPLRSAHLEAIYREVLSASRDLQRSVRVAYLGPAGTFTHQAALNRFGTAAEYVATPTIPDIYAEVVRGAADLGVMPIENSTEGPVNQTLDMLAEGELRISAEITLPISHYLLARVPLKEVRRVYSHPQAAAQCQRWLAQHLPGREVVHVASTTRAAQQAAEEAGAAAIAPELAGEIYQLEVLAANVQDLSHNYTRFFVVGPNGVSRPTGRDKSALAFSVRHKVGALRDVLDVLAGASINLLNIQSRPSRQRAWEYLFFVEIVGHAADPAVAEVLRRAEEHCLFMKVLGAWPVEGVEETTSPPGPLSDAERGSH